MLEPKTNRPCGTSTVMPACFDELADERPRVSVTKLGCDGRGRDVSSDRPTRSQASIEATTSRDSKAARAGGEVDTEAGCDERSLKAFDRCSDERAQVWVALGPGDQVEPVPQAKRRMVRPAQPGQNSRRRRAGRGPVGWLALSRRA